MKNTERITFEYMLTILETLGDKKAKVIAFILKNIDPETKKLYMTQREIQKETDFSNKTINQAFKILYKLGLTKKDKTYIIEMKSIEDS